MLVLPCSMFQRYNRKQIGFGFRSGFDFKRLYDLRQFMQIIWALGKCTGLLWCFPHLKCNVSFPETSTILLPVSDYRMNIVHEYSILDKLFKKLASYNALHKT